jgi:transposase
LSEGKGCPITVGVSAGQSHESAMLEPLLDRVSISGKPGAPRKRFALVSGDKGYDGAALRQAIRQRGSTPLIPHRKDRDGSYPSAAHDFDKVRYRDRNVVERTIGHLKEHRRIATRYDKLAESFRAFIILGCIRIWVQNLLGDRA